MGILRRQRQPFFIPDTAAARARQRGGAEIVLKATKGTASTSDPQARPARQRYARISFAERSCAI